jgi:hypothetical protein
LNAARVWAGNHARIRPHVRAALEGRAPSPSRPGGSAGALLRSGPRTYTPDFGPGGGARLRHALAGHHRGRRSADAPSAASDGSGMRWRACSRLRLPHPGARAGRQGGRLPGGLRQRGGAAARGAAAPDYEGSSSPTCSECRGGLALAMYGRSGRRRGDRRGRIPLPGPG